MLKQNVIDSISTGMDKEIYLYNSIFNDETYSEYVNNIDEYNHQIDRVYHNSIRNLILNKKVVITSEEGFNKFENIKKFYLNHHILNRDEGIVFDISFLSESNENVLIISFKNCETMNIAKLLIIQKISDILETEEYKSDVFGDEFLIVNDNRLLQEKIESLKN